MNKIKEIKEKLEKKEKNVELRILIIGEMGVGKKSIAKRFKLLNCTETKETFFTLSKQEEKKEEKNQKNNTFFSYVDYEETFSEEDELQNKKREEQRLSLMKFVKIYKIDLDSIEISFYPCAEAEPLSLDYIPWNDNENNLFEAKNKISLKKTVNEIAQIIMKPLSNQKNHLELLFIFCFDLSDINSFNQLKLYYSQINQHFDLKKHYHKILVGNKLDKKNLNNDFNNNINKFLEETSLKYYEISTYMFFSFENFFEKIFYNIFWNFPNFTKETFKKNFHNILEKKSTFLQSERKIYETNLNPSPDAYKNNQYDYPKKRKELIKIFIDKEKYNKKIFINKEGPVFPPLPKKNIFKDNLSDLSFDNKEKEKSKENLFSNNNNDIFKNEKIKENGRLIRDTEKQNEIKEVLTPLSKKKGCSLGIITSNSIGLRKDRRDKNIKINLKLSDAINNGLNLNIKKQILKRALSQDDYENNRKDYYKHKFEKLKLTEDAINERHKINEKANNKIIEEKADYYLSKEKKYLKNYIKQQKEKIEQQKKARNKNILNSLSKKKLIHKIDFYCPTSSISTNKGFSFGHKLPTKIKVFSPDFPNLVDDFEKIVIKNNNQLNIIMGAERFPKTKSDICENTENSKLLEKNQQNFEKKRKKFIKNKLVDFFKDRKNKKLIVNQNKKFILEEDKKDFKEQILKQYKTINDYFAREINYNLVESSSPKYTMKGKYNYHTNLSYQSNFKSTDDIFNPYEDEEDENIYTRRKKQYKNNILLLEYPNFDKVKPKYPAFSFGSSERFKSFNKEKTIKSFDENDIFQDGNYVYPDYQSFLKAQTIMGTEKKFRCYKDNGVPGPGNYKIRSFADIISRNGDIINKNREKIKEKENNKFIYQENLEKNDIKKSE